MPDAGFRADHRRGRHGAADLHRRQPAYRIAVRRLAQRHDAFARLIIATDTPTGSGIMPLGMLYTMAHLASLGGIAPELCIAAATGTTRASTGSIAASSPPASQPTSC